MKKAGFSVDFEDLKHFYRTLSVPQGNNDEDFFRFTAQEFSKIFKKHNIKSTFFFIGQDLEKKKNSDDVKALYDEGHEVGNHTYTHPFGFRKCSYREKYDELRKTDRILKKITGSDVTGYRAPCYDYDDSQRDILIKLGYSYDSSVFPSFFNMPLKLLWKVYGKRDSGFGRLGFSFKPLRPYDDNGLLELPITMTPIIRIPFYTTPLLMLGKRFFDILYKRTKKHKTIVFEFHSIDLASNNTKIPKHLVLQKSLQERIALIDYFIDRIKEDFKIMPLEGISR